MSDEAPKVSVSSVSRCPWCHDSIATDMDRAGRVACAGCLAVVHDECWRESGVCPACACVDRLVPEQAVADDRRLCLTCTKWVAADAEKVVCRGCVGVTHPECWPKGAACPGCGDRRRLVPEADSAWLPRYEALGGSLWQRLREHPDFLEWAHPEHVEDLLAKACAGQRRIDGEPPLKGRLILIAGGIALFLFQSQPIAAALAFAIGVFLAYAYTEKSAERQLQAMFADATLEFVPVWVERPPQRDKRGWFVVLRLDPTSNERPDGAKMIEASRLIRRCEVAVPDPHLKFLIPDTALAVMVVRGVLLAVIPLGVLKSRPRRAKPTGIRAEVESSEPENAGEPELAPLDSSPRDRAQA